MSHQRFAARRGRATSYPFQRLRNLPVGSVELTDAFWAPKLKVLREVTVHDVLDKFESDGALRNFDFVSEGRGGYHSGEPWFDGLIYETLRGISDVLAVHGDEALDRRADRIIEKIARAQEAVGDGYLNTYTLLDRPNQRWGDNGGNLRWQHDVYNAGCLVEAGVHHYKATGKTTLLKAAVRFANHLCELMGPPPKRNIVPAHSLPEEALLKLHRLALDEPELQGRLQEPFEAAGYLELARFWIENRGNHDGRPSWEAYAQDHKPLLEQEEAVGHAVRATLLYSGLTALYLSTGEEKYLQTAVKLWDNIAYRKSHINGGVGAVRRDEKFGGDYELPDDGYLETCAAVGMGYFSWNLYLATGESRYVDYLETVLYNILLAGRSMNGRKYFYENPLVSHGQHNRWEWHSCPCCPPMIVKLMPEIDSFVYACDDNGVSVNLYVQSDAALNIREHEVRLKQTTSYPWDGTVDIGVDPGGEASFSMRLRIPGWCRKYAVSVNGQPASFTVVNGFAEIERVWKRGDTVRLDLDMPAALIEAHPNVASHADKVAIRRGPVLYCLESMDNERYAIQRGAVQYTRESLDPDKYRNRKIAPDAGFELEQREDFFDGAVLIRSKDAEGNDIVAIPYPYWNNRSRGAMNIWLSCDKPKAEKGWKRRLYRILNAGSR
ncbi:glycoside hydrolase family 127 protein [Cohnella zeiphila]|uniref:Glycoside hydrolase family 127 protein n=1 Tax=Cohnella zeiphila TaxID=2761120 RepID=A0A7X0VXU3_9BACL|nr:beta-L-arabinofuranosidase domain-containing protein [Cohnella zeiphila]MBB6733822.1 glycoside hydrolase family 127 protein [Cohnella zeiphila]